MTASILPFQDRTKAGSLTTLQAFKLPAIQRRVHQRLFYTWRIPQSPLAHTTGNEERVQKVAGEMRQNVLSMDHPVDDQKGLSLWRERCFPSPSGSLDRHFLKLAY